MTFRGIENEAYDAIPDVRQTDNRNEEKNTDEKIEKGLENDGKKEVMDTVKVNMKKTVGLIGGISLIIGTMIGSGIFASATTVSINSGSVGMTLTTWFGSGLLATLGALCYIELGLMIPSSGGEYSYLMEAFGELPAFMFVYTSNILLKPASVAAIVLATGDYIVEPFEICNDADKIVAAKCLSALFLGVIIFVNCASVKWATKIQVVFTLAKLGAIAMLIITGIVRVCQGYVDNFKDPFVGTETSISKIGYAFYGGLWAYDGWNNLNYCVEELKDPVKDLPRAIMIGIPLVTLLYVLINTSYLTVLTAAEINSSGAVAVTLAERIYGPMAWIVPVLVACSTFGAANGVAFTGGRLVYVSAREGHMPKLLAMIHTERYTPVPAMIFTAIISWVMLIPDSSNFDTLITYFNFAAWIFYGSTFASLVVLRFKNPDMKRPYKVFIGIPIILSLCSVYLVAAPFADYPFESLYCCLFIASGIPLYFCFVKYQLLPQSFLHFIGIATVKTQHLLNVTMPESEDKIIG